ncbi:MAG: citrate synthase [Halobacteriales archaeon]
MTDEIAKGLEGVLVAESELSDIDGDTGRLVYRGYEIEDLAEHATYEEVLYLLWHGHLPAREELSEFKASMAAERAVDDRVIEAIRLLVESVEEPMAALRTGVSTLSAFDAEPDADPNDVEAARRKARRITAAMPTVLAAFERLRTGADPVAPREDLDHAANFLYMLSGEEPGDVAAETLDMSLTLHADHGLNASTFTAMTVSSTLADMYASVTAGIGALSGPLHGGANQDVMEMLVDVDDSEMGPVEWVEAARAEDRRIPGWGHRVYNVIDPRAQILKRKSEELGEASGDRKWYEYTSEIERHLTEDVGLTEKGIAPNVDFYSGSVYYQMGIPIDLYTPIFAVSRVGGWVAHVLEYQSDNRLIRPRGRYVGPETREFVPIDER